MAISPVNAQPGLLVPGINPNSANASKVVSDNAEARVAGVNGDQAAVAAIDTRTATLGAQKSDTLRDERQSNASQEPDKKTLTDAVDKLKNFVQSATSDVSFSIDEDSGIRVVKVVDKETKEVIRQMPSKEAVELAKALDKLQGLMIKQTA